MPENLDAADSGSNFCGDESSRFDVSRTSRAATPRVPTESTYPLGHLQVQQDS